MILSVFRNILWFINILKLYRYFELDRHSQLNGCHLIRADHPSNTKIGGVCIYYKDSLGVRLVKLSNLRQYVVCEVFLQNCKGYIGVVYRSPSQENIEFEKFSA